MNQGDGAIRSSIDCASKEAQVFTELPLVSIITPILNGAKYLEGCIESVLNQDYPRIEHIFVDGGSTDDTMQMLSTYIQTHGERVRVIAEPDTGPGEAWNRGLQVAKGEIFGCLGVDDLYASGAIRSVIEFFAANADAGFVHGDCEIIDHRGEVIGQHHVRPFDFQEFVDTALHIATPSAFYKRVVLERVGWLDPLGDDFDLMIRIAKCFQIYTIPRVLSKLRIREDSAFNPSDFGKRREVYEQTYRVSRRYGGQRFSLIARKYYTVLIISWFHLEVFFPLLRKLYRKVRHVSRF
jgi:glycosyltransferase involved in cell wall biosynthesis